jgi:uncharacterized RDD family membrane protein YckC
MLSDTQILEILAGNDAQAKYSALEQLAHSESSSAAIVEALEKASHDEDMGVVVRAIKALQAPVHHRTALELGLFGQVDAESLADEARLASQPASEAAAKAQPARPGLTSNAGSPQPAEAAQLERATAEAGLLQPPAGAIRRGLALAIDLLILAVITTLIGLLFSALLERIGFYSRLITAVIALLYFSVFNSTLCGGATPGKWLMRIRVVGYDGRYISLPRAILRSTFIVLVLLFYGWLFPGSTTSTVVMFIVSLFTYGTGFAVLYLAVFNRQSGQSIDDLLARTRVAYKRGSLIDAYPATPVRQRLVAIAILLFLPAVVLGTQWVIQNQLSSNASAQSLAPLYRALSRDPRFYMSGVYLMDQPVSGQQSIKLIVINLWPRSSLDDAGRQQLGRDAANLAQQYVPAAIYDGFQVRIVSGFDLGFYEKALVWLCAPPAKCSSQYVRNSFLRYLNFTQNYQLVQ